MPRRSNYGQGVSELRRIAVVGASLAGARTLKALRRKGFDGDLVLIGEECELPYDRPPLSKSFLTSSEPVVPKLLEPESFYDDVELRLGVRAVGLARGDRAVLLDDGTAVRADHVVLATGARARPLRGLPDGERVARLRTAADARRIRQALERGGHLLVIGGGFIGCEVAAAARKRGVAVTLVEPAAALVMRGVGGAVGATMASLHRDNGVDVRLGVGVSSVTARGDRLSVRLSNGVHLEADFTVVGIGASPCTDWLEGAGIGLANGVLCDDRGRAVGGGGGVWAAGDVAAWPSRLFGTTRRLEHWTNAAEQASVLAANLLDDSSTARHDPVPYVWSDQYEHKIQILGQINGDDDMTMLQGSFDERRFAMAYSRAGRISGLVAFNLPREIVSKRPLIAQSAPMAEVA
jgi:3-phenylpropionate/trans-cinnamate dioxygenase ferredoxin reductase subunit